MRAWRVEILRDDPIITPTGITQPSYQLPTNLILQENMYNITDNVAIEFETVVYSNSDNKQVYDRATLSLYNVNRYWHNENSANKLSNAKVYIYGGVKKTPLIERQGLVGNITSTLYALTDSQILEKPLYVGYVANSYPDMDGASTKLLLNLTSERLSKDKLPVNQINLIKGTSWRVEVANFIRALLVQKKMIANVVIGISSPNSVELCQTDFNSMDITEIFDDSKGMSVKTLVQTMFNEVVYKELDTIYIGQKPILPKVHLLNDENILGQPQLTNPSTIVLSVPLTSKFLVGSQVMLNLNSFISYEQNFVADGDSTNSNLLLQRGSIDGGLMYSGLYTVIQIRHTCQSRNAGVDSWCTTLEMVKTI